MLHLLKKIVNKKPFVPQMMSLESASVGSEDYQSDIKKGKYGGMELERREPPDLCSLLLINATLYSRDWVMLFWLL